jgi:uncharacterized membrane protein
LVVFFHKNKQLIREKVSLSLSLSLSLFIYICVIEVVVVTCMGIWWMV